MTRLLLFRRYYFNKNQKRLDEAVNTLQLGIQWLPDYVPFQFHLGDYYKKQNIPYRAKEEYEQALMLKPGNEKSKKRLRSLKRLLLPEQFMEYFPVAPCLPLCISEH